MAQQHPAAIDAGVFHNDVIAVGNLTTLLIHEQAYHDQVSVLRAVADLLDGELNVIEVTADELPIEEAVASYLFNSQLVSLGDRQLLLAPEEILRHERSAAVAARLAETDEIDELVTMDLHQSMRNGGGPACLRLRVVLTDQEQQAVNPQCWLTDDLADELGRWIDRHYRTELSTGDLADPKLLEESRRALDELTQMLDVGSVYEFQR